MKQEDGVGQTRENSKHKQRHMARDINNPLLKHQGELTKPSMRTLSRVTPIVSMMRLMGFASDHRLTQQKVHLSSCCITIQ